jgi:hypothetical protein
MHKYTDYAQEFQPIAHCTSLLYIDGRAVGTTPSLIHHTTTIEGSMDQMQVGQQENGPVMTMKDWIITLLISYIPLVGLIMLIVWAFDANTNPNKKNWAKASLIWMLIGIGIAIVFFILFLGVFMSAVGSFEAQ